MKKRSVHYECPACTGVYSISQPRWRCECGSHLNLSKGAALRPEDLEASTSSLWRYGAALAVDGPRVTLGEGRTPLLSRQWQGHDVSMKLEFMAPTGSFKDRGATVMMSYLKSCGVQRVLEDSSGNGGASVAAYAAAAGISCRILVPASTPEPKVVQMAATGAEVVKVEGSRQDVAEEALRQAAEIFYTSHNWQPFFVEGVKTLGYELWEDLAFHVPDSVVVPLGYGSSVLGLYRSFSELFEAGQIDRMPRIYGVQAAQCAPLHAAFEASSDHLVDVAVGHTVAEGIASSRPVRVREILEAVRRSGGSTVAVSESEIVTALRELAGLGIFVEPTSAAAAAGLTRLIEDGVIAKSEQPVLVLTGSGLKAAGKIGKILQER